MKTEELNRKVNLLKEKVGNEVFTREDCRGITTPETLIKYEVAEKVEYEEVKELTIEEVVEMLNKMDGEDCYYEFDPNYWWEYKVIDGKPCEVTHIKGYRFK